MASRAQDWLTQAKRDLEHAQNDQKEGFYEWGCFSAQQAAEKAVKALYQHLHAEAWGHSVKRLLENLPSQYQAPPDLVRSGTSLDKYYIPTRYPNGFDIGAPMEYFQASDLKEAIHHAQNIIQFCEDKISGS